MTARRPTSRTRNATARIDIDATDRRFVDPLVIKIRVAAQRVMVML